MDQNETHSTSITPPTAFVLLLLYSTTLALHQHLFLPMLLPLIAVSVLYRTHLKKVFKKLFFLNTFIALVGITLLLQNEYDMALLMCVRSNMILLFALLLFCDKDEFSIAIAMHRLKFPAKLTTMIFFTAKSIFLIKHEFDRFKHTLHVRGFEPKTNLLSYQTVAGFVGILVIKAIERAAFLQKAMQLRGFCGQVYSLETTPPFGTYDLILSLITLISLLWHQGALL